MELLVIYADKEITDSLQFALSGKFKADVHTAPSMLAGIECIKQQSLQPDVIIAEQQRDLSRLLKYLKRNRSNAPVIVVTNKEDSEVPEFDTSNIAAYAARTNLLSRLLELIPELTDPAVGEDREYCPLPTHMLARMSPLRGDIYIRLSNRKYIRLFAENDVCTAEDIEKYAVKKKVSHLYLRQQDAGIFLLDVARDLKSRLQQPVIDDAGDEDAAIGAIDSIQAYVRRFGLTNEALEAANKTVEITQKMIGESPKLSNIFNKYMYNTDKYLALHSMVLSHVASGIAAQLSWNLKGTMYKLIMASILHDVTLENDRLASFRNLEELDTATEIGGEIFSTEERERFAKHPLRAAELVESMREVPNDVAEIIRQHHELPDGSGFPRHMTARHISPLASVFIVAHEMVHRLLEDRENFKIEDEFLDLVKKFNHGSSFKEILNVLDPYNPDQYKLMYE